MKVLSVPSSGRIGNQVAYVSPFGQCYRQLVCPTNRRTEAQQRMREVFGGYAQMWSRRLSEQQRARWNAEGAEVWSRPRLGQRGKLAGEQFFTGINSVLGCVGLPPVWEPPARVVFGLSPVRELVIENGENGLRMFLRVNEEWARGDARPPGEEIMVFGQGPCSAGRSKRRNVSYLGLLPVGEEGMAEITELYKAKYGEPRAGTKVFIVTCQQKDGWKGMEQETSEIVPETRVSQMSTERETRPVGDRRSEGENSEKGYMHEGCTRGAQGNREPVVSQIRKGAWRAQRWGNGAAAGAGGGGDGKR